MHSSIQYITRAQLDVNKWNTCIKHNNGLVYSTSWWLDGMADNWDALVEGDYEAVMPLIWRQKYGVRYVYLPAFVQQTGVTGTTKTPLEEWVKKAKQHFKYLEVHFNYANKVPPVFGAVNKMNLILPLAGRYSEISGNYKTGLRKRLKGAQHHEFVYQVSDDVKGVLDWYKAVYGKRFAHVKTVDFEKIKHVFVTHQKYDKVYVRKVLQNNVEVAALIAVEFNKRIYLLVNVTHAVGRKLCATHYIIDCFIKEVSEQVEVLDFEGSSIHSIAEFYKSFRAVEQPYSFVRINQLPIWLRWLKRK